MVTTNHVNQILARNHGNQILAQLLLGFLAGGLCSILRLVNVVSSTGESYLVNLYYFSSRSSSFLLYKFSNEFNSSPNHSRELKTTK